jgi:glycosyltransferase involved in cell wall biosynthesis
MAYRIGFVMEQTLGHVTHTQNFRQWVERDPEVKATWIPVLYDDPEAWGLGPLVRNWTLRASLRARFQIRSALRAERLDVLFFHTQVTALFAQGLMAKIPTVVSMDATPLNFDSIGIPYDHRPSIFRQVELFKNALNRRTFHCARKLITWHKWGKQSLIDDYRVNGDKVVVIPPGIDLDRWHFPRPNVPATSGPVRLLFVGGDFRRKGGDTLLAAFARDLMAHCTLDIVTREKVNTGGLKNIRVHHGLGPNAPELMALYASADVFVFPTLADTLPIVVMEAMASGLPVVTTMVGAVREEVDEGVTGFLIPPNDAEALGQATLHLVTNPELRLKMGAAASRAAFQKFNGSRNYPRVLDVCKSCVVRSDGTPSPVL